MKIRQFIRNIIKLKIPQNEFERMNNQRANTILSKDVFLQSLIGHHIFISEGSRISENSTIDSYTHIGYNTLITKSIIGRYNSIASNVNIGHGEHPIKNISTNLIFCEDAYGILIAKDCVIEHDVWIGVNATIRRGVKISIGAIIGANSFVNKDVPPFAIVAGVPARIIKYRFEQEKIEQILASEWWNKDFTEAKQIIDHL